jgi:4-alpha-glucanotransferase
MAPKKTQNTHPRSTGILLAISSLPTPFAVGACGAQAGLFLAWLKEHQFGYWQVLPISPLGQNDCPYDSSSSFAIDPLYLDASLVKDLGIEAISHFAGGMDGAIDYGQARQATETFLKKAWAQLKQKPDSPLAKDFAQFLVDEQSWLDDWTLYQQLSLVYQSRDFSAWPEPVRKREKSTLNALRQKYHQEMMVASLGQFLAQKSFLALRAAAEENQIKLVGDVPIYVSYESADVWAHQDLFQLDEQGRRIGVSGVPPDAMCADGQIWNHPLYRWDDRGEELKEYWGQRISRCLRFFHQVRLDHFIGFCRYFSIPYGAHASQGAWLKGPGQDLFDYLTEYLGSPLPFIAEDLGAVDEDVHELRRNIDIPGMGVMVFALGGDELHAEQNMEPNMAFYTSTHDTDTLAGTWQEMQNLGPYTPEQHRECLSKALNSAANLVILPWQDVLGLGSSARMNVPGTAQGQWRYRAHAQDFQPMPWLLGMIRESHRLSTPTPTCQ